MPNSGYILQFIKLVTTMIKSYRFNLCNDSRVFKLTGFKLVMKLPVAAKALQNTARSDFDFRACRVLGVVWSLRFSHWRQPLTLNAAIAAMLTSWASLADSGTICTERSRPTSIGPITVAPPSSISILVEIEAEWNAGMISTLAGPDSRQNG